MPNTPVKARHGGPCTCGEGTEEVDLRACWSVSVSLAVIGISRFSEKAYLKI